MPRPDVMNYLERGTYEKTEWLKITARLVAGLERLN